jgi:hypothetical protein
VALYPEPALQRGSHPRGCVTGGGGAQTCVESSCWEGAATPRW